MCYEEMIIRKLENDYLEEPESLTKTIRYSMTQSYTCHVEIEMPWDAEPEDYLSEAWESFDMKDREVEIEESDDWEEV